MIDLNFLDKLNRYIDSFQYLYPRWLKPTIYLKRMQSLEAMLDGMKLERWFPRRVKEHRLPKIVHVPRPHRMQTSTRHRSRQVRLYLKRAS